MQILDQTFYRERKNDTNHIKKFIENLKCVQKHIISIIISMILFISIFNNNNNNNFLYSVTAKSLIAYQVHIHT